MLRLISACSVAPTLPAILRHLVMPGAVAGTREILEWVTRELGPDTYVNVMSQYFPACVNRPPEKSFSWPRQFAKVYADQLQRQSVPGPGMGIQRDSAWKVCRP
jgi:hypothetical protein